tara:strand:+ start:86 stop:301 length:216 start_codon:yes stop_codon:yes gene_type:complete
MNPLSPVQGAERKSMNIQGLLKSCDEKKRRIESLKIQLATLERESAELDILFAPLKAKMSAHDEWCKRNGF